MNRKSIDLFQTVAIFLLKEKGEGRNILLNRVDVAEHFS